MKTKHLVISLACVPLLGGFCPALCGADTDKDVVSVPVSESTSAVSVTKEAPGRDVNVYVGKGPRHEVSVSVTKEFMRDVSTSVTVNKGTGTDVQVIVAPKNKGQGRGFNLHINVMH